MEKITLILSNFASPESARSALRILMQEELISSGNVFQPHFSIYPWDGKIVEETETAALFRAPYEKKEQLIKRLREVHPYELPSIVSIEAESLPDYAAWLKKG